MACPIDDAGNPVRVLDPAGAAEWPVKGDERVALLIHRVGLAAQGRTASGRTAVTLAAVLGGVGLYALCIVGYKAAWPGGPRWPVWALAWTMISVATMVWGRWRVRSSAADLIGLVLEEGLCASCGYNFAGLIGAEAAGAGGGLVTCPECGAAWRRERMLRVEPFAAGAVYGDATRLVERKAASGVDASGAVVKDAAGRRVETLAPSLRSALRGAEPGSPRREALLRARGRIRRSGRAVRWGVFLFFAALSGVVVWLVVRTPGARSPLMMVAMSVFPLTLGLGALLGNFAYRPSWVVRCLVEEGLCPGCAGELEGEGRLKCGKCRAEWEGVPSEPGAGG